MSRFGKNVPIIKAVVATYAAFLLLNPLPVIAQVTSFNSRTVAGTADGLHYLSVVRLLAYAQRKCETGKPFISFLPRSFSSHDFYQLRKNCYRYLYRLEAQINNTMHRRNHSGQENYMCVERIETLEKNL